MKMFKTLAVSGVLAFAGLASAADYSHSLRVTVPFAFVVAGQQFAPGEYNVKETYSGLITVQGEGRAAMVISTPLSARPGEASGLQFDRSGVRDLVSVAVEGAESRAIPVHSITERKLSLGSR